MDIAVNMKSSQIVNAAALKSLSMFAGLTDDAIKRLLGMMEYRKVGPRELIFLEGDEADYFYIILTGKVKVVIRNPGDREFIISFLNEGEFFGEMGLLDKQPRSASVIAVDPCDLLMVSKHEFDAFLAENHIISRHLLNSFAQRMRNVLGKIESLSMLDVYGRAARLLLDTSKMVEGERIYRYRFSEHDFAEMMGDSPEMVSRVLTDLEGVGFLEKRDDLLIVHDRPRHKS